MGGGGGGGRVVYVVVDAREGVINDISRTSSQ